MLALFFFFKIGEKSQFLFTKIKIYLNSMKNLCLYYFSIHTKFRYQTNKISKRKWIFE